VISDTDPTFQKVPDQDPTSYTDLTLQYIQCIESAIVPTNLCDARDFNDFRDDFDVLMVLMTDIHDSPMSMMT
jgi:hypothetical protein